jgi:hypothetical protein
VTPGTPVNHEYGCGDEGVEVGLTIALIRSKLTNTVPVDRRPTI